MSRDLQFDCEKTDAISMLEDDSSCTNEGATMLSPIEKLNKNINLGADGKITEMVMPEEEIRGEPVCSSELMMRTGYGSMNRKFAENVIRKLAERMEKGHPNLQVLFKNSGKDSIYGISCEWVRIVLNAQKISSISPRIPINNKFLFIDNINLRFGLKLGIDLLFVSKEDWKYLVNYYTVSKNTKVLELKSSDIALLSSIEEFSDDNTSNEHEQYRNIDRIIEKIEIVSCNVLNMMPHADFDKYIYSNTEKFQPVDSYCSASTNSCYENNFIIANMVGYSDNNDTVYNECDMGSTMGAHYNNNNDYPYNFDDIDNIDFPDQIDQLDRVNAVNNTNTLDYNNIDNAETVYKILTDVNYNTYTADSGNSDTETLNNLKTTNTNIDLFCYNEVGNIYTPRTGLSNHKYDLLDDKNSPNSTTLEFPTSYSSSLEDNDANAGACPLSTSQQSSVPSKPFPIGAIGIFNMGNTCFMNSSIQCMSSTVPLTLYFLSNNWKKEINKDNPIGSGGQIAKAYAHLLSLLWDVSNNVQSPIIPRDFRIALCKINCVFMDYFQHDNQEFMGFLLDTLHEDLNRVTKKSYIEVPDMKNLSENEMAKCYWDIHKRNNDSIISDIFQGQYKSTIECIKCGERSVTFDVFMFLSLPIFDNTFMFLTIYCVDYSQNSPLDRFVKVELDVPQNIRVKEIMIKLLQQLNIECNDESVAKYKLVLCSSNTISMIFKPSDKIKDKLSNNTLFFVKITSYDSIENSLNVDASLDKKNVILPVYFVKSNVKKLTQVNWQPESVNFPLIFSVPSVIKIPLLASRIAHLKKQRISIKDLLSDLIVLNEIYRESLKTVGLMFCSMLVSNLKPLMNNDRINQIFNDNQSSKNEINPYTTAKTPLNSNIIFNTYQAHTINNGVEINNCNSKKGSLYNIMMSSNNVSIDKNSRKQHNHKNHTLDDVNFLTNIASKPRTLKHPQIEKDASTYLDQCSSTSCESFAEKLYECMKLYMISPHESYNNNWYPYDFTGLVSQFCANRWTIPRLCNVTSFSSALSNDFETKKDGKCHFSIEKDIDIPHSDLNHLCNESGSNMYANNNKNNHNASSYKTPHINNDVVPHNTSHTTSDPITISKSANAETTNELENSQHECSSTDVSWKFENNSSKNLSSVDEAYNFVFRVPNECVLVVEWNEGLLENLFGDSLLCGSNGDRFFLYKDHPANEKVCKNRDEERKKKKNLDLLDCIKAFCSEETLSEKDSWLCPNCKSYQPIKKKLDLWSVPEVLVFHLKRFCGGVQVQRSSQSMKIDILVDAKIDGLDLNDIIIGPKVCSSKNSNGKTISVDNVYDVFAISNHYGSLHGGHYYAYTKNPISNAWYCFDDTNVYALESNKVITPEAYLLLYQRRGSCSVGDLQKYFSQKILPKVVESMCL